MTFQEKYAAIGKQDTHYEGVFITAVKTTGIFCRPSCRARKPKAENVIFFSTAQEAIQNGFRPCKVCKPMEKMGETPEYVQNIIKELHENPYLRIKDFDLVQRGIEPSHIRRWFKQHHNRVGIVIPCHRVIGSDGSLVGYGGGLHRKRWLLDLESQ